METLINLYLHVAHLEKQWHRELYPLTRVYYIVQVWPCSGMEFLYSICPQGNALDVCEKRGTNGRRSEAGKVENGDESCIRMNL